MADLSETTAGLMLEARDLTLSYGQTRALKGVSMSVASGESVAVMGASGSGKSSLLHCLAGVIAPSAGSVHIDGTDLTGMSDRSRSRLRLERVGVVFQFGDLVARVVSS